jgi:precorrin-2 dehydrogenase/sirohydrochlorin ferrochelatase
MAYLPIFLELERRTCVVIGGGPVAERKVQTLREAGAKVVVVSPTVTEGLAASARADTIVHRTRAYQSGDLDGATLVFEATGDSVTARAVAAAASDAGIPINVADQPELCTFIAPAVMRRGGLQIAIATGGASPALARLIREELEERYGPEYELMIDLMAAARGWLRAHVADVSERGRRLTALTRSVMCEALRLGDFAAADAAMLGALGVGLADLGYDRARCIAALRELGIAVVRAN